MAADDTLKKIEERLTRWEGLLSQGGTGAGAQVPGGAIVDPAPWGGGGGGWGWGWHPGWPPHPVVDPAAFHRPVVDPAAFHRPVVDPAAFSHAVVDPAPSPWSGGGWGGGWGGWHWPVPGPIGDQAPMPTPFFARSAATLGRVGPIGDPPPIDVSRFSAAQLEAALHSIAAEQARLTSMQTMIQQHLDKAKQPQKG